MDAIEIPLLTTHAALPERETILVAFAEHHEASAVRAHAMNDVVAFAGEPASDGVADLDALVAGADALQSLEDASASADDATFDLGDDPFAAFEAAEDDVFAALDVAAGPTHDEHAAQSATEVARAEDPEIFDALAEATAASEGMTAEVPVPPVEAPDALGADEPEEATSMMPAFDLPDDDEIDPAAALEAALAAEPAPEPEVVAEAEAEPVTEDAPTKKKARPRKSRKKSKK